MAQHHLHGPEISATVEQMRGKTVAKHVRRELLHDSRLIAVVDEEFPNGHAVEGFTFSIEEQERRISATLQNRPRCFEVFVDNCQRIFADGDETLFVAFPDAAEAANFHLEVGDPQAAEFGDAQTGGIKKLDQGFVAEPDRRGDVRLIKQAINFDDAEKLRQSLAEFWGLDGGARILLDVFLEQAEPEEMTDGDQIAGDGAAVHAGLEKVGQEFHDIAASDLAGEGNAALLLKFNEAAHVALIGEQRVLREAFFDAEVR